MGILTKEIVLIHEWMMHVQFEYIIQASFGQMMPRAADTMVPGTS